VAAHGQKLLFQAGQFLFKRLHQLTLSQSPERRNPEFSGK
jgi:hypothetical protein